MEVQIIHEDLQAQASLEIALVRMNFQQMLMYPASKN